MAVIVASGSAVSVAANTKSSDQVSGQYQFAGKGVYTLTAKSSATGMNLTCSVGGIALADDVAIPFTGTAGTITNENVIASQAMNGGRVQLFLRNTTGGAITTDYILTFTPSGR
jgi:hypothetical protein